MIIKSATFVKGVVGTNEIFEDGKPQVIFIGRSNVGKSSVINSLTNQKKLARSSSTPGRTQEINIFLINRSFYLIDLPGYGYARAPAEVRNQIQKMLYWFLFKSEYNFKKVVLIIDALVGPTKDDLDMFDNLLDSGKDIVIVANKVDKIKKSQLADHLKKVTSAFKDHKVIPFSAEKRVGVGELANELSR